MRNKLSHLPFAGGLANREKRGKLADCTEDILSPAKQKPQNSAERQYKETTERMEANSYSPNSSEGFLRRIFIDSISTACSMKKYLSLHLDSIRKIPVLREEHAPLVQNRPERAAKAQAPFIVHDPRCAIVQATTPVERPPGAVLTLIRREKKTKPAASYCESIDSVISCPSPAGCLSLPPSDRDGPAGDFLERIGLSYKIDVGVPSQKLSRP